DPAARFRDKMVTLGPVLTCPAPAEGDRMSCAPPLKPVFVIVALLADESFLIDFRVLTSWSPYLPNRTNVRFSNRPFRVKRFQPIHHYSVDVAHGLVLLFGIGTRGPSIMGFEDEAGQSLGRPCRQTNGRSKRTCELTSSIVPRGTSFHRSVELECPYSIRCCTVFMLLLWPVVGSSGTRCRQPICGA